MHKNLLLVLGLVVASGLAHAGVEAEIKDDLTAAGCPKGYPFLEDNLKLVVKTEKSKQIELPFCSSYGRAEVSVERDTKNQDFVLLHYGLGRGTNAREGFVKVFRVGARLEERETIRVSAPSGSTSRWFYDVKVTKPVSGGLQFALSLKQEGTESIDVPNEKQRVVNVQ